MTTTNPRSEDRTSIDAWVDAAPFRAQLRHLMAASGLSLPCVALLTGITPRLASRLLHGGGGRALRRISPDTARKLLRVTPGEARAVRTRIVPAEATRRHLRRLLGDGWSVAEVAGMLGVSTDVVDDLAWGAATTCTQLTALRAAAEVALLAARLPVGAASTRTAA